MTHPGERVFDPFLGTGTTIIAALKNGRKGIAAEIDPQYIEIIQNRLKDFQDGKLKTRAMNQEIYDPEKRAKRQNHHKNLFNRDEHFA